MSRRALTPLVVPFALLALVACEKQAKSSIEQSAATSAVGRAAASPSPVADQAARAAPSPNGFADQPTRGVSLMSADSAAVSETAAAAAPPPATVPLSAAALRERAEVAAAMIIRTGQASLEVDSLEPAVARVRDLALRVGGWVANSSLQSGRDQQRTATLEIKVPSASYERAVAGLQPFGRVESVTETAEDVGEEFVDVNARMANARRLEQRLVELLAQRTGRLADVLSVEHELASVREEIERYEGRARFLRTRAAVSTLTVTVHERLPIVAREAGHDPLANAMREAWRNFVAFAAALVAALGYLVPIGALLFVVWRGVVWMTTRPAGPPRPDQPNA